MKGDVGNATLRYIIRDHDAAKFEERKETLRNIEKKINQKWSRGTAVLTIADQYRNMAEIIDGCMHLIDNAKKACENAGVTPLILPIRGGHRRRPVKLQRDCPARTLGPVVTDITDHMSISQWRVWMRRVRLHWNL